MLKKALIAFSSLLILFIVPALIPIGSSDPKPEMEIYLISNEIHTDIVLPVKNQVFDWETFLNPNDFKNRPVKWIEFGWGDRRFYFEMPTWNKFTFSLAADALFTPDTAVMHVNYLDDLPVNYTSARKITVSYETYKKIVDAVKKSFVLKNGKPILIPGKSYSETDNFYEGVGEFSLMRTCNVWTSEILSEADLRHPLWSPTKYGLNVMWY